MVEWKRTLRKATHVLVTSKSQQTRCMEVGLGVMKMTRNSHIHNAFYLHTLRRRIFERCLDKERK